MSFDRKTYFDAVRDSLFSGGMSQSQVDGQEAILAQWEAQSAMTDMRWLAYMLATTFHETAQEMWPIEEYGKGSGQPYGARDPETGQTYYGRGFVQLTWRDNYAKADAELGLEGQASCEWHAENALDLDIASRVMFRGMYEGWFRSPNTLPKFFSASTDDPVGARNIINGDVSKNGELVASYHDKFLDALTASWSEPAPEPEPKVQTVYVEDGVTEVRLIYPS